MNVWFRGAVLAGGALLWFGMHVGAQIRSDSPPRRSGHLVERKNHPVVLRNTHGPEFEGSDRIIAQFRFQQIDPEVAVGLITVPDGVDGIIAYPGTRSLMIRGTREAVAGFRASLEKLDRESSAAGAPATQPAIILAAGAKLQLQADRVESEGDTVHAAGHVVLNLGSGIELRTQEVRITTQGGKKQIVIEK